MSKHRIEEATREMQETAILNTIDALRADITSLSESFLRLTTENARLKAQMKNSKANSIVELRKKLVSKDSALKRKSKRIAIQQQEIADLLAENATLKRKTTRRREKN
ncbi:MAG: hypothetical protein ACD_7C00077G0007 [uncultured bacterium]|nr:MAG: hypothetical protein ACD_7C00077G0007 [uncultured bacterium]